MDCQITNSYQSKSLLPGFNNKYLYDFINKYNGLVII